MKAKRLFMPVQAKWHELYENRVKKWELRGVDEKFNDRTIFPGRRVEIRRGFNHDPLWGTIENKIIVNKIEDIPSDIYEQTIPESVRETSEEFLSEYKAKHNKFIVFKIAIDS